MSSILKGIQLNEVNPHDYDSDWDYQNAVARSGRSRFRSSDSYDAHDDENDAYDMHKRFAATRARKEAEAKAAAEKAAAEKLDELSPQTLASYKKKAGADATAADKRGDYARGNKRMSGIMQATKKEFDNDAKGVSEELDENLHKWFQEKWVRFGPDGKIRGDCARGDDSEGKPKCLPQSKAHSLGKKGRASAASRKRREDPNPERSGKAINVNTKKKSNESVAQGRKQLDELFEPTLDYYTLSNGKTVQVSYRPNPNQSPVPFTDVNVSYVNPSLKPMGPSFDSTGVAQPWTSAPDGVKQAIQKFVTQPQQGVSEEQLDELSCWSGYHRVAGTKAGFPGSCAKNKTNESEHSETCPHCGGEMVSEELMNEKKDACYYKVKSRYKVWPSAYASGALVKCRKKGANNWGTGGKSNESIEEGKDEKIAQLKQDYKTAMHWSENARSPQEREEYRRKALKIKNHLEKQYKQGVAEGSLNESDKFTSWYDWKDQAKSSGYTITKKDDKIIALNKQGQVVGHWSDVGKFLSGKAPRPNFKRPVEQGVAEDQLDEKWSQKYKDSINCSNPKGFSQKAHCAGKQKNESAIMKGLKL